MLSKRPVSALRTHEVINQPPPLADYNLFTTDSVMAAM